MTNIHEIIVKTKKSLWRSSVDTVSFIIYYELCRVRLPNSHSSIVDLGWQVLQKWNKLCTGVPQKVVMLLVLLIHWNWLKLLRMWFTANIRITCHLCYTVLRLWRAGPCMHQYCPYYYNSIGCNDLPHESHAWSYSNFKVLIVNIMTQEL